jgi:glutamate dehydrogenase (NAD(P)+)
LVVQNRKEVKMENKETKTLFDYALGLVDNVSQILNLEPFIVRELKSPCRPPIIIQFAVPMDDGAIMDFILYCVKYNHTRGVHKGGIRAKEENDTQLLLGTLTGLSFDMMIKTAGADLPFGGAKTWLNANPKDPYIQRNWERIIKEMTRAFGDEIGPEEYVPAPDMGTGSREMAWIMDAYQQLHPDSRYWAVVTGKPVALHGCPGRETATARGGQFVLRQLIRDAEKFNCPFSDINGLRIAVQGFGNAGYHFANLIRQDGALVVAVSDSRGGIFNPAGLNVEAVKLHKNRTGSVIDFSDAQNISNEDLLALDCDVLVPAAKENVITLANAPRVKAKIELELANGPVTPAADEILIRNGVTILSDSLANAGGGTVSYFEWCQNLPGQQWTPEEIDERLAYTMNTYTYNVLKTAKDYKVSNRLGAYIVAIKRLAEAIRLRGQYKLPRCK